MLWGGRLAFETFGWRFVTARTWDPVGRQFGALVPIYGTLVTSADRDDHRGAGQLRHRDVPDRDRAELVRGPIGIAIELLAGIPRIIYGMWGLFVFVPFMADTRRAVARRAHRRNGRSSARLFAGPPLGIGMLTAGIVLAIMVIPFISSVDARSVPDRAARR